MSTVTVTALVYGLTAWINSTGMIEPTWPDTMLEVNVTTNLGLTQDLRRCITLDGYAAPPLNELRPLTADWTGLYCQERITIDGEQVDLGTPQGQSVLVHELVHWLQDHNGDWDDAPCFAHREKDAYLIDREWQRQMGWEPEPTLQEIAKLSQCGTLPE